MTCISGKSAPDLVLLAEAGASMSVDGRRYATADLLTVAHALGKEGRLAIVNSDGKATDDLVPIVSAAPGRITLA